MHITTLIYIGIFIICFVFLAFLRIRYDFIMFLDIFLLAVVMFEPSPSDIIFCGLLLFGLTNKALKFDKLKKQGFVLLCLFTYLFVSIFGIIGAADTQLALKYYAITFYLFLFSTFIFLYTSEKSYFLLERAYILSTTFSSILAFAGYAGYFSEYLLTYTYRVKGLFKDPNVFGPFIVPTVIILLDDLKDKKLVKANTPFYIGLITVNTIAIILSFSRAAWINLAIAFLTYFLLNFKRLELKKLLPLGAIFLIISALIWFGAGSNQLKSSFDERTKLQSYDKNRFASQSAGLILASQNPFGYGPGQYENEVSKITAQSISAHNLYIRVLMENGAPGFVLFFTAIGFIVFKLYKGHYLENKTIPLRSSVLLSVLIGILSNSLVVDTLHWRHLWLFLGLSLFNISEYSKNTVIK